MTTDIATAFPMREFLTTDETKHGAVAAFLPCGSSLFISLNNSDIIQWKAPGEVERILKGHRGHWIHGLLLVDEVTLWSGSDDETIKMWNIDTGNCFHTISTGSIVYSLVLWKNHVISGASKHVTAGDPHLYVWDTQGTKVTDWTSRSATADVTSTFCLIEWKGYLCSGHDKGILIKWEDFGKKAQQLDGHSSWVYSLVASEDFLFSGSHDYTIKKWNHKGECVATLTGHTQFVRSLILYNGFLFSSSDDNTVRKWNMDGKLLQLFQGHKSYALAVVAWKGSIFSGDFSKKIIQWTPFYLWGPNTHKSFRASTREGIKTMFLLAAANSFPSKSITSDILFIICQLYATE